MKFALVVVTSLLSARRAAALDGEPRIHDPSTVAQCDGRYYVYGTGRGISVLSSDDGWTWRRDGRVFDKVPESVHSAVPLNDGAGVWAPDVIALNGEYYLYYSISKWGSNVSAVGLVTSPTLDPKNPAYKWTDRGLIVNSVEGEKLNAIDPGVVQAPDGTLWISYGSYIGTVQMTQLDPKTGLRIAKDSPTYVLAGEAEASDVIYRDGYYYVFVNRGSCCKGKDSTYNIRVGRSKQVTGPYLDRYGVDMTRGGGSLFMAASGTQIGPGHFGRIVDGDGIERFSCHYEADAEKDGRSVLDIRPLLWSLDGWPSPGDNPRAGSFQIRSKRTGMVMEVDKAASASGTTVQQGRYVVLDKQTWNLAAARGGYYKIATAGGDKALTLPKATTTQPVDSLPLEAEAFANADNQLWHIDQCTDGSYRIMSKAGKLALTTPVADADKSAIRATDFHGDDTQKWVLTSP